MTTLAQGVLTGSLEDYLETIYELMRGNEYARVRDIAAARGVKPGSVSPAMRRLADLGLISYVQREYISLTDQGREEARRVFARHQLLTRFFREILGMERASAEQDACAMEHSLSPEAMDRLVRMLEFLGNCPDGQGVLDRFHQCGLMRNDIPTCGPGCTNRIHRMGGHPPVQIPLSQVQPGREAVVKTVGGRGALRQRLLDMGILPEVRIEVERLAPTGDPIWIRIQGYQLSLRKGEAESVLVELQG